MSDVDRQRAGAIRSFKTAMSYGDYLALDALLNAQNPLSDAHDEMLFIIQHQTSELWMKLAILELQTARSALVDRQFSMAFKNLARVSRIFEQLNGAWDVLRTMTPSEYTQFREALQTSSGFQSYQYRLIEFILGNRSVALMKLHEHTAEPHALLRAELQRPSLYQEVLGLLYEEFNQTRSGELQLEVPHQPIAEVQQLWQQVYEHSSDHWSLYELAEKLVDLEDYFRRWRFNHVTTVERIIGFKKGTGGTAGVAYLKKMLEVELFPELWRVRGDL